MKNFIFWLYFCLMSLALVSCSAELPTEEAVHFSECQNHCKTTYELCKTECDNHCSECTYCANASAEYRYDKYVNEKEVQGGTIAREVDSYRDLLQCRKVTCNCSADFNVCNQGCTGVIQKQLRAKPYCT